MPGAGAGLIEVFDGADFGGLVRHWGERAGYGGAEYDAQSPFVIPVDPIEHIEGISGAHLRRHPNRRRAMRPVSLRSQRPAPRPRAIERWRPVSAPRTPAVPGQTPSSRSSTRFSAYPAAMGQAGAIDATLLRFPTAQAEISDGPDRAVVTDHASNAIGWAPTASRTPAVQAAERLSADVAARLAPAPAVDVGAWLVPAASPVSADAQLQNMPRAHIARSRRDARVPIAAFEPRIGRIAADASASSSRAPWAGDDIPGALVASPLTPVRALGGEQTGPSSGRDQSSGAAAAGAARSETAGRAVAPKTDPSTPDRTLSRAAETLSAQIIQRSAPPVSDRRARTALADSPARSAVHPRPALPWASPSTPAPGRALFVPAALARLAMQVGETVRPGDAPRAEWPWAAADSMPAPSFVMADQAADGILVEAAAQSRPVETTDSTSVRTDRPKSVTREEPARPPDPVSAVPRRSAPAAPSATAVRQTATRIAARVEARLAHMLSTSANQPDPIALSSLLTQARSGTPDAVWQAQIAADPALAQVLRQIDRLAPRASMTAPLPAAQRLAPTGAVGRQTRLEDGLSVLTGAPASATLFSPSWSQASPVVRAVLGAAGFGPEAHQQPGPAFSFGERLAAVAADLSARHGLSTESSVAGGLDAAWFSEPTGTLVLPMASATLQDAEAQSVQSQTSRTQTAQIQNDQAQRRLLDSTGPAASRPITASRALVGLPSALQAALRGAQRRGPASRLRPVPRLSRVNASIAPESMAMLTQVQTTPPAIIEILARAERLLGGGDAAISALAQSADMPSLLTLARLAEAPDALAALSDGRQAPHILRALARLAPDFNPSSAAQTTPLRAQQRLEQPGGQPPDVFDSLDAALVQIAADTVDGAGSDVAGSDVARSDVARSDVVQPRQDKASTRTPATLAESLKTLTNALPAALRAALATATATPGGTRSSMRSATRPQTSVVAQPTGARGTPARSKPLQTTSGATHAAQRGFAIGAIGQVARRAADWAQLAEAAAPQAFETLVNQTGDIAQSAIARRVLAPRGMLADELTPTWVMPGDATRDAGSSVGQPRTSDVPSAVRRTRAAPIGAGGRRSAAFAHSLDGLGQAPTPQDHRSIWQAADAWTFIASTGANAASGAAARMPIATRAGATVPARAQVNGPGAPQRTAGQRTAGQRTAGQRTAGKRTAMGVPGGKLRWPQATFNWVQAAADAAPTGPGNASSVFSRGAEQVAGQPTGTPARRAAAQQAVAGIASLRSLAVSDRILVQSLEGLGVFGRSTISRAGGPVDPLRPTAAAAPQMSLELALPGSSEPQESGAERFADQTFARQVPITSAHSSEARATEAPTLDVDWVRPVTAVAAETAQLAPRLRSPGNIGRALDVWVDAVKAEAVRSPSAARQALGSVGQLIAQFSTPAGSGARVRSSNVLRGSIFGGRSSSPVTIEPPQDGDTRPALIRPGEHAAQQALRKGTDTVQTSQATTTEEARHKNSEQTDELIPPEEVERLAAEVIDRIKRELEFDAARMGEDGWD